MVRLSEGFMHQIERHGVAAYPDECCGMLAGMRAGDVDTVESILEIENSQDENRARRFLITPQQYLRAEHMAAERGLELLGFYHSHPDHPAIPSAFDTEHALPWFVYIIISIESGKAGTMTAWLLNDQRTEFVEVPLAVHAAQAPLGT